METVEKGESHYRIPTVVSGQKSSTPDIPPPLTSTPITTPTSTLQPAPIEQIEDARYPQSPVQRNLGNTYPAPIQNNSGK